MNTPKYHRADEPIFWLLFGAGGMVVGMVLPSILILLLVAGFTTPDLNEGLLSYAHVKGMLGNWFISLCIFGVLTLCAWHCLHRIYHTLHDLKCPAHKLSWFVLYGAAAALTFIAFALQFLIYCKLF